MIFDNDYDLSELRPLALGLALENQTRTTGETLNT